FPLNKTSSIAQGGKKQRIFCGRPRLAQREFRNGATASSPRLVSNGALRGGAVPAVPPALAHFLEHTLRFCGAYRSCWQRCAAFTPLQLKHTTPISDVGTFFPSRHR